jgi:hypothetical protein
MRDLGQIELSPFLKSAGRMPVNLIAGRRVKDSENIVGQIVVRTVAERLVFGVLAVA